MIEDQDSARPIAGKPIDQVSADLHDKRHPSCGLPLPKPETRCPSPCLNGTAVLCVLQRGETESAT